MGKVQKGRGARAFAWWEKLWLKLPSGNYRISLKKTKEEKKRNGGDQGRGQSWTRELSGRPAREIDLWLKKNTSTSHSRNIMKRKKERDSETKTTEGKRSAISATGEARMAHP